MKTNVHFILGLILSLFIIQSCKSKEELFTGTDEVTTTIHYVPYYISPTDLDIKKYNNENLTRYEYKYYTINLKNEVDKGYPVFIVKTIGDRIESNNKKEFKSLQEKYDPGYVFKRKVKFVNGVAPISDNKPLNPSLSSSIEFIKVSCDKQYDENHKANTNLDNIICFLGSSVYKFIKSGYDKKILINDKSLIKEQFCGFEESLPIKLDLSSLSPENTKILDPLFIIYFKEAPKEHGEYTFKFDIKFENKDTITKYLKCTL